MEMEIQFLENPLGIESDTSQDEDVVPWDGVPWEEDDCQARYQLVKKLKIGHIGAAGKAGQIGADRLKDDYRGKQHISQALSRSCFADCAHAPLGLFNQAPDGMYIKLELSGIEAICSAFDVWGGQSTKPLPNPGEKPVSWKLHWSHQNSVQST